MNIAETEPAGIDLQVLADLYLPNGDKFVFHASIIPEQHFGGRQGPPSRKRP